MHMRTSVIAGLAGGLLFFGHAMVNNSHAWPLVWPALAGAVAVWLAHRERTSGYAADLMSAGIAGVIAGAVFFGATAIALSRLGLLSDNGLSGLAVAALLGLASALVVGGLTHPLAKRA